MRLLIVDDDADLRATLDDALSDQHEVKMAATAFEALALGPERFDVILTDHRMPVMSGLELRQVLHERGVPVPVVLMSSDPDVGGQARRVGFFDFLAKPFGFSQLHGILGRIARRVGRPALNPVSTAADPRSRKTAN
jgi:DNA-binding NtrC family response regulator